MAPAPRSVFLERRTYRRRRLAELSRLLPVAGLLLLLLVPLLWPRGPGGTATSDTILWIFGVWVALVLAAAWLSALRLEGALDRDTAPRPMPGGPDEPGAPADAVPPAPGDRSGGAG